MHNFHCRFLLSEKTSYPFKKYFQSSTGPEDWSDGSDQSLLTASKRSSRSLQPKFSRYGVKLGLRLRLRPESE